MPIKLLIAGIHAGASGSREFSRPVKTWLAGFVVKVLLEIRAYNGMAKIRNHDASRTKAMPHAILYSKLVYGFSFLCRLMDNRT